MTDRDYMERAIMLAKKGMGWTAPGYYCSEDWDFVPKEQIMKGIMQDYPDENFVIIGDRDSDFRAGIVNNVPVIGCAYGFGTEEELKMCNAVACDPASLPEIIADFV